MHHSIIISFKTPFTHKTVIDFFLEQANSPYAPLVLFINGFLSATILPLASEILFLTLVKISHTPFLFLWLVASLGNTLGGMTTILLGRCFPYRSANQNTPRLLMAHRWVQRYGYYALLLSALPLIGDLLCLIAGWQRLNFKLSSLVLFIGKSLRYLLISLPFVL